MSTITDTIDVDVDVTTATSFIEGLRPETDAWRGEVERPSDD